MTFSLSLRADDSQDVISRFRGLSESFCETLTRHRVPFRPYGSPELKYFQALSDEKKLAAIATLEETLSLWSETVAAGDSLLDSRKLLWRALRRLKITPDSGFFDKLGDEDVIEVYHLDYFQVFRNLNFFNYFSCTLEELVSFPIWSLAEFPAEILGMIGQQAAEVAQGKRKGTWQPGIPAYEIREVVGQERLRIGIDLQYFSVGRTEAGSPVMLTCNLSRIVGRG